MAKKPEKYTRPALLASFDPPENHRGIFGWLCGYSADAPFLDQAAERFGGATHAQRAFEGSVKLAMMLDPGNPQIQLRDVPSVLHLPIKEPKTKPFALLHAKVALLLFQGMSEPANWVMRLVVSTGNWTRETIEGSLDLVWSVDLSGADFLTSTEEARAAAADLSAAWQFMQWLINLYDARALRALSRDPQESAAAVFASLMARIAERTDNSTPRFFDNRTQSLLQQLPQMVLRTGEPKTRNYLAVGSGFYDSAIPLSGYSEVLRAIPEVLKGGAGNVPSLLTAQPTIDVFINPLNCQSISQSLKALHDAKFTVRPPGQPAYFDGIHRSLHAKFIFSANLRDNSPYCSRAWIYLGSGNLTRSGFAEPIHPAVGNLEAGVVFSPKYDLCWDFQKDLADLWLENLLPIQRKTTIDTLEVLAGGDMPNRDSQYVAAPVAYFTWTPDVECGWLNVIDPVHNNFQVYTAGGEELHRHDDRFKCGAERPLMVRVVTEAENGNLSCWVPVQDEYGRLAATPLAKLELDEAWSQLASFPLPPSEEDMGDEMGGDGVDRGIKIQTAAETANYPIRKLMQLIEDIADRQTTIGESDWTAWCNRLEQCLCRAASSDTLKKFAVLGINPLTPLWFPAFRPSFAENAKSISGQHYEDALRRIEREWEVEGLSKLEAVHEAEISGMERSSRALNPSS